MVPVWWPVAIAIMMCQHAQLVSLYRAQRMGRVETHRHMTMTPQTWHVTVTPPEPSKSPMQHPSPIT